MPPETARSGSRWRMVSTQNDREHVGSIVMSEDEAVDTLDWEANLHTLAGWTVTEGDRLIVARRGPHVRVVEIREYAPLTDLVT